MCGLHGIHISFEMQISLCAVSILLPAVAVPLRSVSFEGAAPCDITPYLWSPNRSHTLAVMHRHLMGRQVLGEDDSRVFAVA